MLEVVAYLNFDLRFTTTALSGLGHRAQVKSLSEWPLSDYLIYAVALRVIGYRMVY